MSTAIVLGAQWANGDEGKGKLVDILCDSVDLVARAQGGKNAGHTISTEGKSYHFHLLPSGLMNPKCLNLIGSGVVFHVPSFFKELAELEEQGLEKSRERIFISDRAHLSLNIHALVDGLEEIELGGNSIGMTKRGIGPSYSTKASRSGIRVCDIFDKKLFDRKIREIARSYKLRYGDLLQYDVEKEISKFDSYRSELAPYVVDAVPFISSAERANHRILVEGANTLMPDLDFGTYPYVTSSNTGLGGIFTSLGLNPTNIKSIIGVVKAYTTRVGGGPFPTENLGEVGTKLQEIDREFGPTPSLRLLGPGGCEVKNLPNRALSLFEPWNYVYSTAINHYNSLNITKLDVLDTFETIKIAVAYKHPETDQVLESFPADLSLLENVKVVYHEMPGWQTPTTGAKIYYDLPKNARAYIDFIEEDVGVKVSHIDVGAGRTSMITK